MKPRCTVQVRSAQALLELTHEYPDRLVQLAVWQVDGFSGVPAGLEGQPLRWESPAALRALPLLAADLPIVDRLESLATPET